MSPEAAIGRAVVDRYELLEVLGRGPVGVVWRGRDRERNREVAVREVQLPDVLDDAEQGALAEKVLREAHTAARLDHPGAVAVFDAVSQDGQPYVITELVLAPTLAEWVAEHGPLSPGEAAAMGTDLVDTLAAAHRQQLVHRDVRPSNVLLTSSGAARLADFGVSSMVDDPKVTASGAVPEPFYLAPEQTESAGASNLSDLWSLGATLYFAVEGVPPFDGGDPATTIAAIVGDRPRPARRAGSLQPVLDALLVKDPTARPDDEATRRLLVAATTPARGQAIPPTESDGGTPPAVAPPPEDAGEASEAVATAGAGRPYEAMREPWFFGLPVATVPPPPVAEATNPVAVAAPPQRTLSPSRFPRGAWIALLAVVVGAVMVALITTGGRQLRSSGSTPGAPNPIAAPSSWLPYNDPTTGFTFRYPPGWEVRRTGSQTFFVDPATNDYFAVDHRQPPPPSPVAAWIDQEKSFSPTHQGYNRLQMLPTIYQGFPAAVWEYTYTQSGTELHAYNLGFIAGRYGFALTFQTGATDWARAQNVLEAFKSVFEPPA